MNLVRWSVPVGLSGELYGHRQDQECKENGLHFHASIVETVYITSLSIDLQYMVALKSICNQLPEPIKVNNMYQHEKM